MVRFVTLKEILDDSTDKAKEIREEINKINDILKITNPKSQAYLGWENRKKELEDQLTMVAKEWLKRKEQTYPVREPPIEPEDIEGGDKNEEFQKVVGGPLGSKDKEVRGGNAPGGSKDPDKGEPHAQGKVLTEARKFDQKYYNFLDILRKSGVTNMFGAAPYLVQQFPGLDERKAKEILIDWMETFGKEGLNPNSPGVPKTDEQRKIDHKKKFGTDELPPRGTGIKKESNIDNYPKYFDWIQKNVVDRGLYPGDKITGQALEREFPELHPGEGAHVVNEFIRTRMGQEKLKEQSSFDIVAEDANVIAQKMFGKNFNELTKEQQSKVMDEYDKTQRRLLGKESLKEQILPKEGDRVRIVSGIYANHFGIVKGSKDGTYKVKIEDIPGEPIVDIGDGAVMAEKFIKKEEKLIKEVIKEFMKSPMRLREQTYLTTSQLRPGMKVMHKDWNLSTSEPMEVVKVDKKIMLRLPNHPDTEPTVGGESDYGWFVVESLKEAKDDRPPKDWWDKCISAVSGSSKTPEKLCGWIWSHHKLGESFQETLKRYSEQKMVYSKVNGKWFFDMGNYYIDADTGERRDAAQFPTGDLVREKPKVKKEAFEVLIKESLRLIETNEEKFRYEGDAELFDTGTVVKSRLSPDEAVKKFMAREGVTGRKVSNVESKSYEIEEKYSGGYPPILVEVWKGKFISQDSGKTYTIKGCYDGDFLYYEVR